MCLYYLSIDISTFMQLYKAIQHGLSSEQNKSKVMQHAKVKTPAGVCCIHYNNKGVPFIFYTENGYISQLGLVWFISNKSIGDKSTTFDL